MIFNILQTHYDTLRNLFGPFFWVFMVISMSLYFIASLIIANYVHKDAIRRGIRNCEFWLLIGLIFNVLGLLLYLLVRKNYEEKTSHPKPKEINK